MQMMPPQMMFSPHMQMQVQMPLPRPPPPPPQPKVRAKEELSSSEGEDEYGVGADEDVVYSSGDELEHNDADKVRLLPRTNIPMTLTATARIN